MTNGTMALARIQQADGRIKPRPVVILQEMGRIAMSWCVPSVRSFVMNAKVSMKSSI